MPKFTVYRNHSPSYYKRCMKSILTPVDVVKTPGFSLGLLHTTTLYPTNDIHRYRIRTVLASRVERKVIRSLANTPDIESIWPRQSIPSKNHSSHSRLLKHGIKVKKITQTPSQTNPKFMSISQIPKTFSEDARLRPNKVNKSLENHGIQYLPGLQEENQVGVTDDASPDCRELLESPQDDTGVKRNNKSMDDQYNLEASKALPTIWVPLRMNNSPEIRRASTGLHCKKGVPKQIEKVSVKEAMRDRDWVMKARGQLIKDLHFHMNWSNGLTVHAPKEAGFTYKYYLGSGNNSKLVKQLMSARWWWVRVTEEEKDQANLIWTQWKEWSVITNLPCLGDIHPEVEATCRFSIFSKTKYHPVNINNLPIHPRPVDVSPLGYELITKSSSFTHMVARHSYLTPEIKIHNKIEHNYHLSNKKALYYNLVRYYKALGTDPFEYIPLTFHVKTGETDPAFAQFEEKFCEYDREVDENGKRFANIWIIKPGENTNRGNGITVVSSIAQVREELKNNPCPSTGQHTYIIQKYIERPYLINKRKFDIRCYAMITCVNGTLQGYFYQEGYLRTSSKNFSLCNNNKYVHLTNDAVQKNSDDYGRYEKANKMSYVDFQRYLDNHQSNKVNFAAEVLPAIRKIVKDSIQAVFLRIDTNKRGHTFEVFGYDFILDCNLKPWLLEVNTNPCLELSSPHLARIIPAMLDNSLRLALDPLFPEPQNNKRLCTEGLPENKYELIFHSNTDGNEIMRTLEGMKKLKEFNEIDCDLLEMVNEESEEHPESEEVLC